MGIFKKSKIVDETIYGGTTADAFRVLAKAHWHNFTDPDGIETNELKFGGTYASDADERIIKTIENTEVAIDTGPFFCEFSARVRVVGDENCLPPIGWLQQRDMTNLPFVQNLDLDNWFNNIIINIPINTILLMVIMIWMFTGFAAVVFSAGIKAIPSEIMEAGQIDGASEFKVFTSIVIPYIKSTIVVVGTYMVVTVLKAFDIIYVGTRGDLETNLLAVKMLDEFSKYRNIGRSATVAVIIFVCVFPIIWFTIKRERETVE